MKRVMWFLIFTLVFLSVFASSGGDPNRSNYGINAVYAIDSIIDTMNTGRTLSNGMAYNGRYFYIINNGTSRMYLMDYFYGLEDSFAMYCAFCQEVCIIVL